MGKIHAIESYFWERIAMQADFFYLRPISLYEGLNSFTADDIILKPNFLQVGPRGLHNKSHP